MVPFSRELKSQKRGEKIWALHLTNYTVNIRTIRPENISQMHGKKITLFKEKKLVFILVPESRTRSRSLGTQKPQSRSPETKIFRDFDNTITDHVLSVCSLVRDT